jgi:hypothetical protein
MIWLFKLTVTPLLIAAATLVTRRYGPRVGGLLLGFPLMSGPLSVFFAIEQGRTFAVIAALGTLLAIAAIAGFSCTYALMAPFAGWSLCLLASTVVFFAISIAMSYLDLGLLGAAVAAYASIAAAVLIVRAPRTLPRLGKSPWWDIWARMGASGVLVGTISLAAAWLGPVWSGIIGTFPVLTTVVICFMHRQWGWEAAIVGLRGILMSLCGFVSFFVAAGAALPTLGLLQSYLAAVAAAIATSAAGVMIERVANAQPRDPTTADE